MSETPWVKWFPSDFLNGIAELDPNEIAMYAVVLNRIYDEGGPIADDVRALARRCNMRPTSADKALDALAKRGKIVRKEGTIRNLRCEKEIKSRQKVNQKSTQAANTRWQNQREKANEINKPKMHAHKPSICLEDAIPEAICQKPDREEESAVADSSAGADARAADPDPGGGTKRASRRSANADAVVTVFDAYNECAKRTPWPVARDLNETRKRSIAKRIEENGLAKVLAALERGSKSRFLCGQGQSAWSMPGIDWFLKPANFQKIVEGSYDDRTTAGRPTGRDAAIEAAYAGLADDLGVSPPGRRSDHPAADERNGNVVDLGPAEYARRRT